jgi:hypothetical protein
MTHLTASAAVAQISHQSKSFYPTGLAACARYISSKPVLRVRQNPKANCTSRALESYRKARFQNSPTPKRSTFTIPALVLEQNQGHLR